MIKERKMSRSDIGSLFPDIPDRMNKGGMGRVLVICGSYEPNGLSMCGAAYFAAKAAYRCGAGIVEIFTPRENYSALSQLVPEAVFSLYGYDESCETVAVRVKAEAEKCDAAVLGCGLGKSNMSKAIVKAVFESISRPLVIDADGLNILSDDASLWRLLSEEQRCKTVITPHPGEMSRLTGKAISTIVDNVSKAAVEFSREKGIVCLLKDHNTVVTNGDITYINQSGNAGMATAGMGDVLAGIIGAILARTNNCEKHDVLLCAAAGAYLHGCAGDIASAKIGRYSLNSSDLLAEIPSSIAEIFGKI